jgi:MbtH protein
MPNPFDDEDALFLVLINDEGQYSLWPTFMDVPAGWAKVYGEESRSKCLQFIEDNWTDMRPRSLVLAMESEGSTAQGHRPEAPGQEPR